MKVDNHGRIILNAEELFEALYRGEELSEIYAEGEEIDRYNELCLYNDKTEYLFAKPLGNGGKSNEERRKEWALPPAYRDIDPWEILSKRCSDDTQIDRLKQEKIEYEARDLTDLVRLMIYLVDHFRSNNIVWGVGRGSSVASFALYLIGITKINPMKYGLEISDFLKN